MHCKITGLLLALFVFGSLEQLCRATCDARTLRNNQNGPLEVCEKNGTGDKVFLPLCAQPTADKTASLYCTATPCEKKCNQYNYTVAYKPNKVNGFIYQCEPNDNKPKQCELTTGLCDSVIETLNCECNTSSCPDGYVSDTSFCANNTCSCLPEFAGANCLESVCEIGLLRTNTGGNYASAFEVCADPFGVHDWFPICTSSSDFLSIVGPICWRTSTSCRRLDCNRASFTFTPSTNNTMGYSVACNSPFDILSNCTLTYGLCSTDILATLECMDSCSRECANGGFCLLDSTCLCPSNYTGDSCELSASNTTNATSPPSPAHYKMNFWIILYCLFPVVVVCLLLCICVIVLITYIKSRPSKLQALDRMIIFTARPHTPTIHMNNPCTTTEEVVYASVKLENMLASTAVDNSSGRTIENRYTTSSRYKNSSVSSNSISEVGERDRNYSNVENMLYLSVLPNTRTVETQYATSTAAIHNKAFLYSSTIVLSHRERIDSAIADSLKQGESYFANKTVFVEPPTDVEGVYNTLADFKFREINRDCISLQQQLGTGYFGDVHRAEWKAEQDTDPIPVAAKCLNDSADSKLRLSFLTEAAIMGQFDHPNVLRLLGIVSLTTPYMLVIELMQGDLKSVLESIAAVTFDDDKLMSCLLKCSREIVCGMEYLSSKHFIHRDLAARNVLVGQDMVCRIGDFGMSKRMHEDKDYYRVKLGGVVPVKWTAPEALFFRRYSEKSDVWSLGMTLFEVWSVGSRPWSGYTNEQVMGLVSSEQIQGPPTGCPHGIYAIMVKTWYSKPTERPTFHDIAQLLKQEDEQLLYLPEELKSEKSGQLGNDPALSADLYPDLRN